MHPTARTIRLAASLMATMIAASGTRAVSQDRYYLLNQTAPTGMAGSWAVATYPGIGNYFQPVRVDVPEAGQVTFFSTGGQATPAQPSPANAALQVGRVYRVKISDLPDFPGVEFYPTVELLDRLHPPPGKATRYPVPISFTLEELDQVAQGRLVTKIVYVEQPDRASPIDSTRQTLSQTLSPRDNALATADQLGRPIAIVRLGSRVPDLQQPDPSFFGSGAPVMVPQAASTLPTRPRVTQE